MGLSNVSYNLVTALQSKLEALAAYDRYIQDCQKAGDDAGRQVFELLKQQDDQHVDRLRSELERRVRDGSFT